MAEIKLDIEQKESFEVKDRSGKLIGTIEFNAHDLNIVKRLKEVYKAVEKYEAEEEQKPKPEDLNNGTVEDTIKAVDEFEAKEKFLWDQIDYAFNSKVSEVVFKDISAFTPIGGKLYFEIFLDGIISIVEKSLKKEAESFHKKTDKYTKKYVK